jgi:hypothetical protein
MLALLLREHASKKCFGASVDALALLLMLALLLRKHASTKCFGASVAKCLRFCRASILSVRSLQKRKHFVCQKLALLFDAENVLLEPNTCSSYFVYLRQSSQDQLFVC